MGTKNEPGAFDCYGNALPDEPMFILLARDPSAPVLISRWAAMRANDVSAGRRPPTDMAMVEEAEACAHAMEVWRAANWPSRKGDAVEPTTIRLADHDGRVTELLAANNREVERRRAAETALAGLKDLQR